MNFKDMLDKISQLSEATKEVKGGKVHTADKGGYGRKDDDENTSDEAPKAGKDTPKGDIFGRTSGEVPASAKTKKEKKGLKEYFNSLDKAISEMQQPIPVLDQGNKQAGVGVVTSKNPAIEKMLSQLSPQDLQVVMKGQAGQQSGQPQQQASTSGGATNQPAMEEGKDEGKPGKNFAKIAKKAGAKYGSKAAGERVAGAVRAKLMKQGKIEEADLPNSGPDMGAGLGAGRDQSVTEGAKPDFLDVDKDGNKKESFKKAVKDKKKVKESMDNRLKAAHHAGRAHGLTGQAHCGKNYEDMEEARMYHEGYKQGLDECYGQVPIQGLTVADESAQGTVDDMASFGAHTPAMEDEMDEGNAFTKALAKTPQGDKFALGGKTFTDNSGYDAKVFESWDNQLNSLLEEYNTIQEGISVSVSKGQQGAPDSVSVTAQDADADKLLALVKHAGLGLFGDEAAAAEVGVPAGDQQHGGVDVVGDHDGMMALIKKSTGSDQPGTLEPADSSEDYADEGGEDDGGLGALKQLTKALGGGSSEESDEEEVEEDNEAIGGPADETGEEYMDQEEETVAEDNPPGTGAEEFAEIDAETAEDNAAASSHGGAQNSNIEEGEHTCNECGMMESECGCEHEEQVEESYANSDDDGFQADIDFMTKIISGGLNKQKSTGQTTTPVIAGQNDREGYSVQESVSDWKKLAGLK